MFAETNSKSNFFICFKVQLIESSVANWATDRRKSTQATDFLN